MTTENCASRGRGRILLACLIVFLVGLTLGLYFMGGPGAFRRLAYALPPAIRPSWAHPLGLAPADGTRPQLNRVRQDVLADEAPGSLPPSIREIPPFSPEHPLQFGLKRTSKEGGQAPDPASSQVAQPASPSQPSAAPRPKAAPRSDTGADARAARGSSTLAFWNQLNDIIERELHMRETPSQDSLDETAAGGFLERRKAAAQFAVEAIRELDRQDVDGDVARLADRIVAWYDRTVAASDAALGLLNKAPEHERKGARGQQWQREEENLGKEVERINADARALREALSKRFGLAFPPLK